MMEICEITLKLIIIVKNKSKMCFLQWENIYDPSEIFITFTQIKF